MKTPLGALVGLSMALLWACLDFEPVREAICDGGLDCADAGPPPNYVFVTSVKVAPGGIGGVDAADAICQGLADNAGLKGTYRAWLPAGGSESALSRLKNARGWIRPDDRPSIDQIADNGVSGKSLHPPVLTERGIPIPAGEPVFTGTSKTGDISPNNNCQFWTKNSDDAGTAFGNPYWTISGEWTDEISTWPCNVPARFYCFGIDYAAPLKVPAPTAARRAFITRANFAGGGGGLREADRLCQSEAQAAGLQGQYLAFLGSTWSSPGGRFDAGGPNWYRVDDIPIAETPSDLLNAASSWVPLASLNLVAAGGAYVNNYVWTGVSSPSTTIASGSASPCSDWTLSSSSVSAIVGHSGNVGGYFYYDMISCSTPLPLYCLQQ